MPTVPPDCTLLLKPEDDYNHPPDEVSNFNESMYFSLFDRSQSMGGWYRLGNRVHEGYSEMSICWYLPDGRVAFMAGRPEIHSNERMDAGGLRFEILAPLKRQRVTYEGGLCLLERPEEMADPSRAFRENPIVPARMEIEHSAASRCPGGEIVRADGTPIPVDPEKTFGKAHFDQETFGRGFLELDGRRFQLEGEGARDKTWGPRYWQSIDWYRWLHFYVSPECSVMATVISEDGGGYGVSGFVFEGGPEGESHEVEEGQITSRMDENGYLRSLDFNMRSQGRDYEIHGDVFSLIPLRNRRAKPDGSMMVTRIMEAMTEFTCNGERALGMAEYLDQIVDGRPIGE